MNGTDTHTHITVNGRPLKEAVDKELRTEIEEVRQENVRDVSRRTQIISKPKFGEKFNLKRQQQIDHLVKQEQIFRDLMKKSPDGMMYADVLKAPGIKLTQPQFSVLLRKAGFTTDPRGRERWVRPLRQGETLIRQPRKRRTRAQIQADLALGVKPKKNKFIKVRASSEIVPIPQSATSIPKLFAGSIRSELVMFARAMREIERKRTRHYRRLRDLARTEAKNWGEMVLRLIEAEKPSAK